MNQMCKHAVTSTEIVHQPDFQSNFPPNQIQKMFQKADKDGDGELKQFLQMSPLGLILNSFWWWARIEAWRNFSTEEDLPKIVRQRFSKIFSFH